MHMHSSVFFPMDMRELCKTPIQKPQREGLLKAPIQRGLCKSSLERGKSSRGFAHIMATLQVPMKKGLNLGQVITFTFMTEEF